MGLFNKLFGKKKSGQSLSQQGGKPEFNCDNITAEPRKIIAKRDMFREAAKLIVSKGTLTNSSLSRRFSISYVLSGQILELLVSAGVAAKEEKGIWRAMVNEEQLNSMPLDEYDKVFQKIIDEREVKSNTDPIGVQSHLRILNDSLSLIDKTTNLETLNGRYETALEKIDRLYANGKELNHLTKIQALEMVAANKNENIVRVATYINNKVKESVKALKTDNGRKNAEAKAMQRLNQCIISLVDAQNKTSSLCEITKLITGFSSAFTSVGVSDISGRLINKEVDYRRKEQMRWPQNDSVVGYEIKLGANKDHCDICEQLAGKYPKNFKWSGWYDGCRCYQVSIMKNDDEFWRDLENGDDEATEPSVNEVTDLPENFKRWVKDNADLIRKYEADGTAPNFITDNMEIIERILK